MLVELLIRYFGLTENELGRHLLAQSHDEVAIVIEPAMSLRGTTRAVCRIPYQNFHQSYVRNEYYFSPNCSARSPTFRTRPEKIRPWIGYKPYQ
jgi:hypothetical protein